MKKPIENAIRAEHKAMIFKALSLPEFTSIAEFPEPVLGALVIADEIRRSAAQICKALEELNKTQKEIRDNLTEDESVI